ncbi:MAG: GntR family transcriptional regulator [Gammaproteobacteria bacterium]
MELTAKKNSDEIVDLVFEAILSKKLNPGVKLSEIALQDEFGFSRNVIREGFSKLVDSGVLIHKKNQSVRVACPSEIQTKKIYQARKAIENGVILILVDRHIKDNLDMSQMNDLIAKEEQLHESDQFAKLTRMSCDFHISLAELCGNEYLVESLKPLIPLSALAASVYASPDSHFCSYTEHQELISALNSKNPEVAIRTMSAHLDHCVQSLDFEAKAKQKTSYSHIFN